MNNLYFKVAEAFFNIDYRHDDDLRNRIPSFAPFHVSPEQASDLIFTLEVGSVDIPFEGCGREVGQFDCGGINHGIYWHPSGGYLMLISDYEGKPACAMRTTGDFRLCQACLFGDETRQNFGLGNAVMIAYAFAGAYHHILLMHSSVTMAKGGGHLFLGKSGTGKSTHSQQWLKYLPDTELLNDDNPALRYHPETRQVMVYGTPWSGKTPCYRNLSVPARAIVRLEQYPENLIRRESPLQAFASVLSSCSTMIWDKSSYRLICDTIAKVAEHVPVFHLQCRPDREAAILCSSSIDKAYES